MPAISTLGVIISRTVLSSNLIIDLIISDSSSSRPPFSSPRSAKISNSSSVSNSFSYLGKKFSTNLFIKFRKIVIGYKIIINSLRGIYTILAKLLENLIAKVFGRISPNIINTVDIIKTSNKIILVLFPT